MFFFCEVEPKIGGETPIVLSHVIYNKMKQKYPEFVDRLEEHGLIYTRVLGEDDDPSSPIGRGWVSTFLTKDKTIAAERFVIDPIANLPAFYILVTFLIEIRKEKIFFFM